MGNKDDPKSNRRLERVTSLRRLALLLLKFETSDACLSAMDFVESWFSGGNPDVALKHTSGRSRMFVRRGQQHGTEQRRFVLVSVHQWRGDRSTFQGLLGAANLLP